MKIQLKVKNLTPGTRYYAFARNEMGKSPGTRKRLKVPALPLPTAWLANMPNAGNGWVESVWFLQKFDELSAGSMLQQIVRMVSGCGWIPKDGFGPVAGLGRIPGTTIRVVALLPRTAEGRKPLFFDYDTPGGKKTHFSS